MNWRTIFGLKKKPKKGKLIKNIKFLHKLKMTEMSKPLIGVLAHNHKAQTLGFGSNAAYIEFARKFGNVVLIDPVNPDPLPINLLLLPGGRDVNPVRYGDAPSIYTQPSDPQYEWFYTQVFHKYVELASKNKLAIYGICAGFQNLNVVFGGKINQDIDQVQSTKWRGELVDDLQLFAEHQLFEVPEHWITGKRSSRISNTTISNSWLKTNSIHHQGVFDHTVLKKSFIDRIPYKHTMSPEMVTLAINKDFGNVEVMRHKSLPIIAEQAHPEERTDPVYTNMLINYLLEKVMG